MGLGIKAKLLSHYKQRLLTSQIKQEQLYEQQLVMQYYNLSKLAGLSAGEVTAIRSIWGGQIECFDEYRLFKTVKGFDPRYLSHFIYLPVLARKLNDYRLTKLFEDKGLQGFIVNSNIRSPKVYTRRIDGEYYNSSMNQVSFNEAVAECVDRNLIIKDSKDSSGGKGISKISSSKANIDRIKADFDSRNGDFVVQECISQSLEMAKFNPSSINTFRITTLYLNGKYSLCNICMRMGREGSTVDNWGSGGIMIGVNTDGSLKDTAYDIRLNKYKSSNGITFKGQVIKEIPSILKEIEIAHKNYFSLCKFIGWDICIDENNEPVLIELNSSQPGVIGEQICNGPIFGDRTEEVIEYCRSKKFEYNRALFRY